MRFDDGSKIVGFFSNVWKEASDNDAQPDQCQNCLNFGYRLVKTCVVAVFCPKPSEDDPADLTTPLLPKADQGVVAKQPDRNDMSESGPDSDLYFVGNYEAEAVGTVPFESFGGGAPEPWENHESLLGGSTEPGKNYQSLVAESPKPEENNESLVAESPKPEEDNESLVADSPKPEEKYEPLVDESPKLKVDYDTLVVNLSQPDVNVTNEQLGVKE
ncbi:hypothetical protein [Endozoicomonas sp. GU-1]|uniref:hypothetical protein n=1 Tax=Endozoicomonas sp. GU-1 TaxID=3009078 RepID=UPI0022B45D7D|nr:hypothetical protein [Endozoicomonas sp. GU-1]WBA81009.1 hypothetical protein O2T12_22340 [Endozoicomonas sp. GU-1]